MAQTPRTWDDYVGDGVEDTYQVTFPYQKAQEVFVTVNGEPVKFTFISEGWVQLAAAPASGAAIRIRRSTEAYEPRREFANGVPLLPRFIDENNKQFLHVVQETVNETAVVAADALDVAEGARDVAEEARGIAQAAYNKADAVANESALQLRLDLSNAIDPNKGAQLIGYKGRTVAQKLDGLGTAALLTATTSRTDNTVGRAMRVGDHGIGIATTAPATLGNIDDTSEWSAGNYRANKATTGGTLPYDWGNVLRWGGGVNGVRSEWLVDLFAGTNDQLYFRTRTNGGNFTAWKAIYHDGDQTSLCTTVDSVAALRQVKKGTSPKTVATRGYYGPGTYGAGVYTLDPADTTSVDNGGTIIVANDGGRWKLQHNGIVSVAQFGALPMADGAGDGVDSTAQFKAALAAVTTVVVPAGNWRITDLLDIRQGCRLIGTQKASTKLYFDNAAGLTSKAACVRMAHFAELYDITINQYQPAYTNRAALLKYPPAILLSGATRCCIDNVRLENVWDGIRGTGNFGGLTLGRVEVGAYQYAVDLDGALDFVHIQKLHMWPFGMTENTSAMNIYNDGGTRGAVFGAIESLNVDSISTFGSPVQFKTNAVTTLPALIGRIQLDGDRSKLTVQGGVLEIGAVYSTKSASWGQESLLVNGAGAVVGIGAYFASTSGPAYEVRNSGGRLMIRGGMFHCVHTSGGAVWNGGPLAVSELSGVEFRPQQGVTYANAFVVQADGVVRVTNCRFWSRLSGSLTSFVFASDNSSNLLRDTDIGGWGLPVIRTNSVSDISTRAAGYYGDLANVPSRRERVEEQIHTVSIDATSDSTGKFVFNLDHNLTGRVVRCQVQMPGAYGQVMVFGGSDNNPIRVFPAFVQYTNNAFPGTKGRCIIEYVNTVRGF